MGGRASAASKNAWNAKAYDRINVTVPKGRKAEIQTAAAAAGESVNAYITGAINRRMESEDPPVGDTGTSSPGGLSP